MKTFKSAVPAILLSVTLALTSCAHEQLLPRFATGGKVWFGLHVPLENRASAEEMLKEIPALAALGVNLIITEINYNYEYKSHPELSSDDPISRKTIKKMVALCRQHKIRLIPQFQCLGHQSWEKETFPLLKKYKHFDETPGLYPGNKDIYCRSWCPLNPGVNPIIFDLFDELIEAFEADAFHVGMDEVFLIADDRCPFCKGKSPADLFAKAVNDYYGHIVKKRGLEMLMWGDRLIDGEATGYGEWEASKNKTYPAVDMIPKDIIICDWHYKRTYEKASNHPSLRMFLEKGFLVLPASYDDVEAANAFFDESLRIGSKRIIGHLCTIWKGPMAGVTSKFPALKAIAKRVKALPK